MDDLQLTDPSRLVAAIRNGDAQAETRLVQKYWRGVVIMLEQRTGDHARAEDLAQDTMVVVLSRLRKDGIENPPALGSYIQQTAKFLFLGQLRKRDSQLELTDTSDTDFSVDSGADIQHESGETSHLVRQLLGEMRVVRDRELLLRYYVYEQTKNDICDALELTADQFDRVLHRARKRFHDLAEPVVSQLMEGGALE